jgi:Ca2+-dependent lipid-binding protein
VVKLGQQVKKTRVHDEGGKKPRWNDTLNFTRGTDTNLKIEIWDKDVIDDDLVGEGFLNLTKVYNCPNTPQNGIRRLTQKLLI